LYIEKIFLETVKFLSNASSVTQCKQIRAKNLGLVRFLHNYTLFFIRTTF